MKFYIVIFWVKCNDKIQLWLQSEKITENLHEGVRKFVELYYRSRDNSRNMIFNLLQSKNEKIRETVITDKNLHITL